MQATLLKRFDALAGPLLVRLFPKRRGVAAAAPRSLLVIRPGGIGDAVLLIPALRALQSAYPSCRIEILAEKRNAAAFQLCTGLGPVRRYDEPRELAAVMRGSYDLVIDTEQWYRLSAVIARLVRAGRSIGFDTNERERLFSDPVSYSLQDYEPFSFFRLLAPLQVEPPAELAVPFLDLPPGARDGAARLLAPLGNKPFVALFPGASVPQKEWGVENFVQVAQGLARGGIALVLVGGPGERPAADSIAREAGALNLAGEGSLPESAAVIGASRVLLTGDSGLLHIAAGLGTPTVSLFGPSDPAKWAPRGGRHVVFSSKLHCASCARWGTIPPCSHEGSCLDADPAEVVAAIIRLFSGR